MSAACQCCGNAALREIAAFSSLPRVTSDSKPFPAGGRLFVCGCCGLAQKIADACWLGEIAGIYADYDMHHQSGTHDQVVFDSVSGVPRGRCEVIVRRLKDWGGMPSMGTLLDVGTGGGAMVAAFSSEFPGWKLCGLDLDARKASVLKQIAGFEELFTCPPHELDRCFEFVTLVHALEHFVEPAQMLASLRQRLAPGGRLFVEVNNAAQTPFDLVVADHLCHLTPQTLRALVVGAGFEVEVLKTDWLAKELSLVAGIPSGIRREEAAKLDPEAAHAMVTANVSWLEQLLAQGASLAKAGSFGIFGTSVAATWLAGFLGDKVAFFIDEDPARAGRTHLGRPVFGPSEARAGSRVYLAFPAPIARSIARRLAALPLHFEIPQHAP